MAGMGTAIVVPAKKVPLRLTRQDTFLDVTMAKKRPNRIVPIIAVHETLPPTQDVGDSILEEKRSSS
jgi:hypothetical protein